MPVISTPKIDIYSILDGLNTVKSGVRIGPTELKNCQNIRYFPLGGFKWRPGYATLGNQTGMACVGLYMARFSSNTNVAFRIQGATLESMASLNGTWTDRTNGQTITSGQNNLFTFDILNDVVIAVNGVDTALQINSSLVAATVALPGALIPSACFMHRGYMFYITSDKAYFSDKNDPTTVGTNNFVQPGSKIGGNLIGGIDFNGKVYLWRRRGIYATEFQPTATDTTGSLFPFVSNPNPVVAGIGTQSHRSIVRFTTPSTHKNPGQELVFFVDQFGVPRLFDGSTSISIGSSIHTSRDSNITSLDSMDKTRMPYVWALNDSANNLIYCFMSSSGQTKHDVCWIMDYNTTFAWSRDAYADTFNCGTLFEDNNGVFTPYFANYQGQVFQMNTTQTDNGTAISSYARTGDLYIDSPAVRSGWLYNEIRGSTGSDTQTIHIDYFQDGEDTASATGDIILFRQGQAYWDATTTLWDGFNWVYAGLTTKSSEINLDAKTLSIQYSNTTSGNSGVIEGFTVFARPEGWKQES